MKETAGTLLYRNGSSTIEVLLVHPAGNYNKRSPWSIPKGLPDPSELLEDTARRETEEETGVIAEQLHSLGFVEYTKSKKRVHCFVGLAPENANPHCASGEVDRAEFVPITKAKKMIHPDQSPLLSRLEHFLRKNTK